MPKDFWFKPITGKMSGKEFVEEYAWKQHTSWSLALDKQRTSYQPLDQIMRRTREEKIRNEEDSNYGVTTLESSNFKDVWSFNHPH